MERIRLNLVVRNPAALEPGPARLIHELGDAPFADVDAVVASDAGQHQDTALGAIVDLEAWLAPAPADPDLPTQVDRAVVFTGPSFSEAAADHRVIVDFVMDDRLIDLAHHVDADLWRLSAYESLAGAGALVADAPTDIVTLSQYNHQDGRWEVIDSAHYNPKILLSRHQAYIREKSVLLVLRSLRRLAMANACDPRPALSGVDAPLTRSPSTLRYLVRTTRKIGRRTAEFLLEKARLRPRMWLLKHGHGDPSDADLEAAKEILPPRNRFWADPFLFEHEGASFVFYEDYDYRTRRGVISVARLEGGDFKPLGTALATNYHLSYPFVFRRGEEIFMLPETNQIHRIEIWRCRSFPLEWELHATALEGIRSADSVIATVDGATWLFTNIASDATGDHCTELYIYRIDGPDLNHVEPHKANPVVIDSRYARSGGRVFQHEGVLIRSAQDNSHGAYGYGVRLMRIEELTLEVYRETVFRDLASGTGRYCGAHHIDFQGGAYIMDACVPVGGFGRRTVSS